MNEINYITFFGIINQNQATNDEIIKLHWNSYAIDTCVIQSLIKNLIGQERASNITLMYHDIAFAMNTLGIHYKKNSGQKVVL
jgi:hypothetical protein